MNSRAKTVQKQHKLAVALLHKLGLQNICLERRKDGTYRYYAWNVPMLDGNGSPGISRQGLVRQQKDWSGVYR
jgi:hypothetical protein